MKTFYQRNLPHFHFEYSYLFLTMRLLNSLPAQVVLKLKNDYLRKKNSIIRAFDGNLRSEKLYEHQKRYFGIFDRHLDLNRECINYLSEPRIAELVYDSIRHRDGKVYNLISFCIMPNHAHMLIYVKRFDKPFYRVTQSFKRYTARESNKIINREGAFWHDETFDHVVRDKSEYFKINRYILDNPFNAGLVKKPSDWKWRYCKFAQ